MMCSDCYWSGNQCPDEYYFIQKGYCCNRFKPLHEKGEGLISKYIVRKSSDNSPVDNCFVLRPEKDPAAVAALKEYAQATPNAQLAADLMQWVEALERR